MRVSSASTTTGQPSRTALNCPIFAKNHDQDRSEGEWSGRRDSNPRHSAWEAKRRIVRAFDCNERKGGYLEECRDELESALDNRQELQCEQNDDYGANGDDDVGAEVIGFARLGVPSPKSPPQTDPARREENCQTVSHANDVSGIDAPITVAYVASV